MKSIKLAGKAIYPSKIVCIGRNYVDHIKELGNEMPTEPVIFLKPNSAIANDINTDEIDAVHYEGELTFMVQFGALAAVGFGLDLTKRAVQNRLKDKGLPWERSKAFDGAAVFSEFVSLDSDDSDISTLRLELTINDQLIQQGGCELMINQPEDILAEVRHFMSFEDGDLIMTGTPAGVGKVKAGDSFNGKVFQGEKLLIDATWTAKS